MLQADRRIDSRRVGIRGLSQGGWLSLLAASRKAVDDYMRGSGDRATSRWRKEIEFDPLRTLDGLKIPALLIYGAADPVVPVAVSVERLRAYPKIDVVVIAGADHSMQVSVPPQVQMDPARSDEQAPEAVEYFARLASWLARQAIATPEWPVISPPLQH